MFLFDQACRASSNHDQTVPAKALISAALLMCASTTSTVADTSSELSSAEALVRYTVQAICEQRELPFEIVSKTPIQGRDRDIGQRHLYETPPVGSLQIEAINPNNRQPSYRVTVFNSAGQPNLFVALNPQCRIQLARKIIYENRQAISLHHLDQSLAVTVKTEPVNPPVPEGKDPGGVRVGIIDSGVNYLLPEISNRLARDEQGNIIGYDYWDQDAQPFDSNPAKSEFFPQRHGTRTASLLLREAGQASLVPYRYPRPDMTRISDLIEHAARNQFHIIAMPLGSKNREEWLPFLHSAESHPEILFIISSGNNGVNIDEQPIYPAAFQLDNLITVSAADEIPVPATMTNWGRNSTHILLPADRQYAVDFDGREKLVSGTSYAVSRIAALAARIAHRHPDWNTRQLRQQIINMADPEHASQYTAHGLLNDPLSDMATIKALSSESLIAEATNADARKLAIQIALLQGSGWELPEARVAAVEAQNIFRQCNIVVDITLNQYSVPDYLLDFHSLSSRTLVDNININRPTIFLVRDTRRVEAFGGEAFGRKNTRRMPWLENTAWLINQQHDIGIMLAHELVHILVDNGDHNEEAGNLMNEDTAPENVRLNALQCEQIRSSKLLGP